MSSIQLVTGIKPGTPVPTTAGHFSADQAKARKDWNGKCAPIIVVLGRLGVTGKQTFGQAQRSPPICLLRCGLTCRPL
jgi:hypothetical protein